MRILFICTSNKDRSPALEKYFSIVMPSYRFFSAGVNAYFCKKHQTHFVTEDNIKFDADFIVFAEDIHLQVLESRYGKIFGVDDGKIHYFILNAGEFKEPYGEDYLQRAHLKLNERLHRLPELR